uniref:Uncharacterized protein n=1 Tax=Meloidogyne enterolobii TaxID=390850 RepID=A0A6V7X333_MELEN|nr:unnamed protein product [Meloidogyne enterolobii]
MKKIIIFLLFLITIISFEFTTMEKISIVKTAVLIKCEKKRLMYLRTNLMKLLRTQIKTKNKNNKNKKTKNNRQ